MKNFQPEGHTVENEGNKSGKLLGRLGLGKHAEDGIHGLIAGLGELPKDPSEALEKLANYLRGKNFTYREKIASVDEVIETQSGSCLGLTLLAAILLEAGGKEPHCKVLIHPKDAADIADRKLFSDLSAGGYWKDYDHPKIPNISDQPKQEDRQHRFVPLGHPLVVLEGVPFETTLIGEADSNPLVEFPSESSRMLEAESLASYQYSDQAKVALERIWGSAKVKPEDQQDLEMNVDKSMDILADNRDALMMQWNLAKITQNAAMQKQAVDKMLTIGPIDSDMSYKLWLTTGDVNFLDKTLDQFPEHIPAFLDKKVFMEKDPREARVNLAIALWCVCYSSLFDLKKVYADGQIKAKVKELFPNVKP